MEESDLDDIMLGEALKKDDILASCGCCDVSMEHKQETPEFCNYVDTLLISDESNRSLLRGGFRR